MKQISVGDEFIAQKDFRTAHFDDVVNAGSIGNVINYELPADDESAAIVYTLRFRDGSEAVMTESDIEQYMQEYYE